MDWPAFALSLKLAAWTATILVPIGIVLGRVLAWRHFKGKSLIEALLALPLVLPPTVLGFYLLVAMGGNSAIGRLYQSLLGDSLVFTFSGLVVASVVFNLPFAIQPMQRGFEAIPDDIRDAAACCGLSRWRIFTRIELPLAWPGILSGVVLTFAHTLGEFGVVLMVGGSIPDETKTIAIAIYDRVQAFDSAAAGLMSAALLVFSFMSIAFVYLLSNRGNRRHA
ncbi:MAG: molybdate ABC transporter permease subunit [Burkholderiales bacterium]|nr:molybdate ABC transporter permease subunit [Burkholderiales bacterium]